MAERTPGKWRKEGLTIRVRNKGIIASFPIPQKGGVFECDANAEFFWRAINSHDALVKALEDVSRFEKTDGRRHSKACRIMIDGTCNRPNECEQIDAALKLAKEEIHGWAIAQSGTLGGGAECLRGRIYADVEGA